jgi:hypothetical protein
MRIGGINGFWPGMVRVFGWDFWKAIQRRGVHVSTPKIGSRDGELCFGGIYEFCAELRREFKGGEFKLVIFGVVLVGPREPEEEGGHLCYSFGCLGEFYLCTSL